MATIEETQLQRPRQPATASSTRQKQLFALFLACALAQLVLQLVPVLRGVPYIASHLTKDDAYYCFETAWNLRHTGVPTFDGLHRTNGVQFLWFWLVYGVTFISASKSALVTNVMLLGVALNLAAYWPIWRIGSVLGRPGLALLMGLWWCHFNFHHGVMLYGVDAPAHALLMWLLVYEVSRLLLTFDPAPAQPPRLMRVALLLSLMVWARLDSAFLVMPIYLYLLWHFRRETPGETIRMALPSAALAAGAAVLLLLGYYWMGGVPLPVSGLIKQKTHRWLPIDPNLLWGMARRGFPVVEVWNDYIPWRARTPIGIGILAWIAASAAMVARPGAYLRQTGLARLGPFYATLVFACFLQLYYWAGLQTYTAPPWYQSPWYVLCTITAAIWTHCLLCRAIARRNWELAVAGTVVALVLLSCFATFVDGRLQWLKQRELYARRVEVAGWMSENIPEDCICAAWNAGQLGYFSDQRVINLDGLINSYAYFKEVLSQKKPLQAYFTENKVDYVVDYVVEKKTERLPFLSKLEEVAAFPVPGEQQTIRVWKVPRMTELVQADGPARVTSRSDGF